VLATLSGLVGWLLFTFLAAISGAVTAQAAAEFYLRLERPPWAPPAWLFGPAWSVLYPMMAVAAWTIWRDFGFRGAQGALVLYVVQLLFNAAWSWLFFVRRSGIASFVDVVLLWSSVAATLVAFWQLHTSAGILFVPYLAWVTFAAALNLSVWRRNPGLL
jgi:tryptophan-rich sensory protein